MRDYFRTVGPEIKARNDTGKFAVEYLDLNDSKSVAYRQMVIDICSVYGAEIRDMERMEKKLGVRIRKSADDEEKTFLRAEFEKLEQRLQRALLRNY
jgi:hypothetical protein